MRINISETIMQTVHEALESEVLATIAVGWGRTAEARNTLRSAVLVPLIRVSLWACIVGSLILLAEKVFMGFMSLMAKILRRRPHRIYPCTPLAEDEEMGDLAFPNVLVQIPMFNEREVYHLSIGAACSLEWPASRIIVQVLDDSTDLLTADLVEKECKKWVEKGINVTYERRETRKGYKAGALQQGMNHDYVAHCQYVTIFDADFQPDPDFLKQTIPYLVHNPDVALVQSRWKFVNADECLMTRIQEMTLDYHFKVEQESGSSTLAFFGFNGTAGVWRIHALNEAGGWKDRTTVEDMDLAIRATLNGWKFIYLGHVKVQSELPSTFKAYRYQQHRWSCGPASLVKKLAMEIVKSKKVSFWKKMYLMYNFLIVRRIISHMATFFLYCVIVPSTSFFPEVQVPFWSLVYIPTSITLLHSIATPRSFHLLLFWILLENVMSLHRSKAVVIGLLEISRVNEWIVTQKLGLNSQKTRKHNGQMFSCNGMAKYLTRFHLLELGIGVYLLLCAAYNYVYKEDYIFIYIFLQSLAFIVVGVGYVGAFVHSK